KSAIVARPRPAATISAPADRRSIAAGGRGAPLAPGPASRPAPARAAAPARQRRVRPLEQLALALGPARPRWSFSRRVLGSPHRARICERLEFVRRFYPELDGITVRVGMALKRGVLGWGSLARFEREVAQVFG